jgi:hypothetical protein
MLTFISFDRPKPGHAQGQIAARGLGVEVEIGQARPHLAQVPVDPAGVSSS